MHKHIIYNTHKLYLSLFTLAFLLLVSNTSIAQNINRLSDDNISGFYTGIGTGYNITSNTNLIKTYRNSDGTVGYQNMGNVRATSTPILFDLGYRFNKYISTEFLYTYSGTQDYKQPPQNKFNKVDYWGTQSTFSTNVIGYLPITEHLYLKGRTGLAYSKNGLTTYIGDPGTGSFTSVLGGGLQYFMTKSISLDFDYINYGALAPMKLEYRPPAGGPNLGTVDSIISNQFFLSLNIHI